MVFGTNGAVAGLWGTVDVLASVRGLKFSDGGEGIELGGLPFSGSVRVGKGTFFKLKLDLRDWFRRHFG